MKAEYQLVLKSGMFWEFHPELTGDWDKDKTQWRKIYNQLKKSRNGSSKNEH
jgi:hypothetical protein